MVTACAVVKTGDVGKKRDREGVAPEGLHLAQSKNNQKKPMEIEMLQEEMEDSGEEDSRGSTK